MADFFPKLAVQAWMREDGQKLKDDNTHLVKAV